MTQKEPSRERPLHVLTITPFYPKAGDEASGCFVSEPLAEMIKNGLRSTVFAVEPIYRPSSSPSETAPAAEWLRYPAFPGNRGLASSGIGLHLRLRGAMGDLQAKSPIDLIHAHGALPCGDAARRLSRHFKIPYLVTVHGLDAFSSRQVQGWPGEWCHRVSRQVYEAARGVFGVSQHVCDEVKLGVKNSRTSVVYNGVDSSLFQPGEDPAEPVLLTVGNLIPSKGHALVVEALAALRHEFPALRWDVIGDGPEMDRLHNLAAERDVLNRIHFHGRRNRAEVAEAYRRCTLYVMPSDYEGLGCVYLEAMASTKVAVGCTGQGIEEVIRHGENGWLVPPRGQRELTEGLRVLLQDIELRRRMGAAGRRTIEQSFSLQHQAQRLLGLYQDACL